MLGETSHDPRSALLPAASMPAFAASVSTEEIVKTASIDVSLVNAPFTAFEIAVALANEVADIKANSYELNEEEKRKVAELQRQQLFIMKQLENLLK